MVIFSGNFPFFPGTYVDIFHFEQILKIFDTLSKKEHQNSQVGKFPLPTLHIITLDWAYKVNKYLLYFTIIYIEFRIFILFALTSLQSTLEFSINILHLLVYDLCHPVHSLFETFYYKSYYN